MRLLAFAVWLAAASPWLRSLLRPELAALRGSVAALTDYLRSES